MSELREAHNFNVKAVSQETGIKADTLRAWERRYGLPSPERSQGGHRLYSQRDIDILNWLVDRQAEGLSISNAVDLWNQLIEDGQQPLTMPEYLPEESGPAATPVVAGDTVEALREQWVRACKAYDGRQADEVLNQSFGLYSVETVVLGILRSGISEIGQGWFEGAVVVQQEHFASEMAVRRLETLISATPPPSRSERLLLVCPPHEQHTIGLLIVALLLRRRGWPVIYLGADVPLDQLQSPLEAVHPRLVISLAQQITTAATLQDLAALLHDRKIPLAYGGEVFRLLPELRRRIAGHYLGDLIQRAPSNVENLVSHPHPVAAVPEPSAAYLQALAAYQSQLRQIQAQVVGQLEPRDGGGPLSLEEINDYMAMGVLAGLRLGDLAFFEHDLRWVRELMVRHQVDPTLLEGYLLAYQQAVQEQIPEAGAPLVVWLTRVRSRLG